MDYQSYQPVPPESKRRSKRMEHVAFILGIIAIATPCLVYPALICGALGMVFALLSRGGEAKLTARAKVGLILSSAALGMVVLLLLYTIIVANVYYGGIEEMARQVYGNMGIDYDMLIRSLYAQ